MSQSESPLLTQRRRSESSHGHMVHSAGEDVKHRVDRGEVVTSAAGRPAPPIFSCAMLAVCHHTGGELQELSRSWFLDLSFIFIRSRLQCLHYSPTVVFSSPARLCWFWTAAFFLFMLIWKLLSLWKHRHLHLGLFPNEPLLGLMCHTLQGCDSGRRL